MNSNKKELSPERREVLLKALKARFEKNMNRHRGLEWDKVQAKLQASGEKLSSLNEMERTGGEPDVVGHDKKTGEYIFYDCSAESPKGRRSVCYDREKEKVLARASPLGVKLTRCRLTTDCWPSWKACDSSGFPRNSRSSTKTAAPLERICRFILFSVRLATSRSDESDEDFRRF
jgi:hypothetical protein